MRGRWMGAASTAAAAVVVLGSPLQANAATVQVASWQMDDGGTTMADATGRGHVGTLHNVKVRQPGVSGSAFGFLSKPSYVTVPSASDLNPGTGNFSYTVRVRFSVRPSPTVVDYDLLRKGLSTTAGGSYKMEILQSGAAYCNFRGSTGEAKVIGSANLANNVWHTITCSRTPTSVRLTVDGSSVAKTISTGTISNTSPVYIGAKDSAGNDQYAGLMDAVTVSLG